MNIFEAFLGAAYVLDIEKRVDDRYAKERQRQQLAEAVERQRLRQLEEQRKR